MLPPSGGRRDILPIWIPDLLKTINPISSRVSNVRLRWYCEELPVSPVRCGLSTKAERKATHSDRLTFLCTGNQRSDDPIVITGTAQLIGC